MIALPKHTLLGPVPQVTTMATFRERHKAKVGYIPAVVVRFVRQDLLALEGSAGLPFPAEEERLL